MRSIERWRGPKYRTHTNTICSPESATNSALPTQWIHAIPGDSRYWLVPSTRATFVSFFPIIPRAGHLRVTRSRYSELLEFCFSDVELETRTPSAQSTTRNCARWYKMTQTQELQKGMRMFPLKGWGFFHMARNVQNLGMTTFSPRFS